MPREHLGQPRAAGARECHGDAPVVVDSRTPDDESDLLEQADLVGQAAPTDHHPVGELRHPAVTPRSVTERRQELELDVAEIADVAQLLLDRVSDEAADLDQGEVGAEFGGVERLALLGFGHGDIVPVASNSKQWYRPIMYFEFEAHDRTPTKGNPMRAVRFHEVGGPEVLRVEETDRPTPSAGEVLVRVAASAYNAADNGMRGGFLPIPVELPHVPGYDVSGTVEQLGEGVTDLRVGDAVVGFLPMERDGGAAEFVVAPAQALVPAPTTIPLADAAALPSVALTAWQALFDDGRLTTGQRLLVVGAGGAVGGHAVRLAKRAGVEVVATASPRSADMVRSAGADVVVDHTEQDLLTAVDGTVDVLLNLAPLDPDRFAALVALVHDGGAVVSTTAFIPTPGDEDRGVRAATVFVRPDRERLRELVRLVDAGELRVDVTRRIPLGALPALHEEGAAGRIAGKVVVLAG